ncbi:MAG: DNA polymerase III subunit gamma/tau [Leptolyngbyaceae cyanobacterium]
MAYEPLHHKYRPQTFTELVGQDAIATTLTHALEQRRIAPAYLFCGPRGTGKTSSARILAKSLNCLSAPAPTAQPCGTCDICQGINSGAVLDIVEIDAASNTGVDNIRELIERAQFAPVQCRYKVYVIDECHMLSTAAFNALLKTLEEPPEQVIFVLATTDPQRVLPTIISRCQRFDFRRIPLEAMVSHLQTIVEKEAIAINADAVRLVAQVAQGGLRDAESLLDQLSLLVPPVTVEKVWDLVGAVPEQDLLALVAAIAANDSVTVLDQARTLMDRGREPLIVLQNLAGFYRDLLIAKTAGSRSDLVAVTSNTWTEMERFSQSVDLSTLLSGQTRLREAEVQIKNTTQPRLWLEVTLLGLLPAAISTAFPVAPTTPKISAPAPRPAAPVAPLTPAASAPAPVAPPVSAPVRQPKAPLTASAPVARESGAPDLVPPAAPPAPAAAPEAEPVPTTPAADLSPVWAQVVAQLQPLGTRALMQQQGHLLSFEGQSARIGIRSKPLFKMAQGRITNIEAAFEQVYQHPVKVSIEVAEAPAAPPISTPAASAPGPAPQTIPQPAPRPQSPAASTPVPAAPTPDPAPPDWTQETDLDRAVKSFAEFFNGQIVDLDEDDPSGDENGEGKATGNSSSNEGRDKLKDVPF